MWIEILYCCMESFVIGTFLLQYFTQKDVLNKPLRVLITYSWILFFSVFVTVTHLNDSWYLVALPNIAVFFIIMHLIFNGSKWEKLLIAIIATGMLALSDLLTLSVLDNIFDISYDSQLGNTGGILQRFMAVLIAKLVYATVMSWIVVLRRKLYAKFTLSEYVMLSITFLISIGMVITARNIVIKTDAEQFPVLFMILCVILLNVGQLVTMVHIAKKNMERYQMDMMRMQLEFQADNIKEMEKSYQEITKLRHDMKHYISCALQLSKSSHYEELTAYLDSILQEKINATTILVKTSRPTIAAVINAKLNLAKKNGYDIHCTILNEWNSIPDIDISILLSNLLDNALEACQKNIEKSSIVLKMWSNAGYYCLDIANSVEYDVLMQNPNMITKKTNTALHGYGLRSVRDIVNQYDGMMHFQQNQDLFHVCVSLKIQPTK